ncbi:helix-turn-helix domain-containing protein [Deinococcus sp. HMF7604]|uniref:helix-turn-helix domain-containing protein n=1 Tax=Deinococcus betulae TaxID=2873312 RepID=UPI001CCF2ADB|nr:helix-turn-helix transcriptional regulator [Deinococcus betulae]MBZ9752764.1 helix-turn-helix domain-containing protein [Deinococcus betulae]
MTSLKNLKSLRDSRGWTQQELADKASVHVDVIRKHEQNAVKDTLLSIAHPIAKALDVSIEALFLSESSHETLKVAEQVPA